MGSYIYVICFQRIELSPIWPFRDKYNGACSAAELPPRLPFLKRSTIPPHRCIALFHLGACSAGAVASSCAPISCVIEFWQPPET